MFRSILLYVYFCLFLAGTTHAAQEPMKPHPEQVASVLSFVTWTFLDKVIYKAYKVPHLSLDMLPAVADYDRAKNLRKKAFVVSAAISRTISTIYMVECSISTYFRAVNRSTFFGA